MTKTVLLGTTNPAKIKRFEELLRGYAVQFYTLRDLHIEQELRETGATPRENAELKAKFYGQYFDLVICNDSGLYFDDLPLEDPRQPGLHIRTPQGERLDDEQMISYYTTLVHSLGGRVLAYYLDGVAVYRQGKIFSLMEAKEVAKQHAFYMVDSPARERHPGWPLDSLSQDCKTQRYFVEKRTEAEKAAAQEEILEKDRSKLLAFLVETLELERE